MLLRYVYDTIRLWEIPPERVIESDQYGLWPLAGLMGNTTSKRNRRPACPD